MHRESMLICLVVFSLGGVLQAQVTEEASSTPVYVVQDATNATKYQCVSYFFKCVEFRRFLLEGQGWEGPMQRFAAHFGIDFGTTAWDALLEASRKVAAMESTGLVVTKEMAAAADFYDRQWAFQRRRVLELRQIYDTFLQELRESGFDAGALDATIGEEMKHLVRVVGTAPRAHPNVQRSIEIELLFEEEKPDGDSVKQ